MKTKEAIEHIKHKYVAYDDEYCAGTEEIEKLYKQQDEVIEVLKRGEKFEEMWGELEMYVEGMSEALTHKMNMLWQKYIIGEGGNQ